MPAADANAGARRRGGRVRRRPTTPPPAYKPGGGDTDKGRGVEQATKYKRSSKTYQRRVVNTYREQPPERRAEIVVAARKQPNTVESRAILRENRARAERARQIARSQATKDTKGDRDRGRGDAQFRKDATERAENKLREDLIAGLERRRRGQAGLNPLAVIAPLAQLANKNEVSRDALDLILGQVVATKEAVKNSPDSKVREATKDSLLPTVLGAAASIANLGFTATTDPYRKAFKGEFKTDDLVSKMAKDSVKQLRESGEEAVTDPKAFKKTLQERGALPELSNLAGVGGPALSVPGRIAIASARAGFDPADSGRFATYVAAPRPRLRTESGTSDRGARDQELGNTLSRVVLQRRQDKRRQRRFEDRRQAGERNGQGTRGLIPQQGEVVRSSLFLQNAGLGKAFDTVKSRTHTKKTAQVAREVQGATLRNPVTGRNERVGTRAERDQATRGLNDQQKQDFEALHTFALEGMVNFRSPETTREVLRDYEDLVVTNRAKDPDTKVAPEADAVAYLSRAFEALDRPDAPKVLAALQAYHAPQVARQRRLRAKSQVRTPRTAELRALAPVARVVRTPAGRRASEDFAAKLQAIETQVAQREAGRKSIAEIKRQRAAIGDAKAAALIAKIEQDVQGLPERKDAEALIRREEEAYIQFVKAEASRRGLAEPVYVKHRRDNSDEYSDYAGAGPERTIQGDKQSFFSLFERGMIDRTPDAYDAGVAKTIRRQENWNSVADVVERFAVPGEFRKPQKDGTIVPEKRMVATKEEWRQFLTNKGWNKADWRIVSLGRTRGEADTLDPSDPNADLARAPTMRVDASDSGFDASGGFMLVPKKIADRMEDAAKPSNLGGRTMEKLMGFQSRLILSTSPTYIPVQVASQLLVGIPSTRGRILLPLLQGSAEAAASTPVGVRVLRGRLPGKHYLRGASPEVQDFIDSLLGASMSVDATKTQRFGSVTPQSMKKWAVAYRALVNPERVRAASDHPANPFAWNRKMDETQNRIFRRAMLEAELKKDKGEIVEKVHGVHTEITKLLDIFDMPPGPEQMKLIRANEKNFERVVEKVDDMLGNWTRYSPVERRYMKRAFLFYGFLRYATRFAFYTMPVKHPSVSALLATMGQLQNEEIIDLLGQRVEEESKGAYTREDAEKALRRSLLSTIGGRIYYVTESGDLGFVDTGKLNPATGPGLQFLSSPLKAAAGLMSPVLQSGVNAALGEKVAIKARINANQAITGFGEEPDKSTKYFARIIGRDLMRANPLIRAADEAATDKNQVMGDDALPFIDEIMGWDRELIPGTPNEGAKLERKMDKRLPTPAGRAQRAVVSTFTNKDLETVQRVEDEADFGEAKVQEDIMGKVLREFGLRGYQDAGKREARVERAKRDPRYKRAKKEYDRVKDRQEQRLPKPPRRRRSGSSPYGGGGPYG